MKKPSGTVSVEECNGRLRLRLPRYIYGGKQKYLSLRLADTPLNRKAAESKALTIELDILSLTFDPTLNKYKPLVYSQALTRNEDTLEDVLTEKLFQQYIDFKKNFNSPSTVANDYERVKRIIPRLPVNSVNSCKEARQVKDWLLQNCTAGIAKRIIIQLSAAFDWGVCTQIVQGNYFKGLAKDIKIPKNTEAVNGFSLQERNKIIDFMEVNFNFYEPLVSFLFLTGCRPSEAIALRLADVSNNFIFFRRAAVDSVDGIVIKEGLKTQAERKFPVNIQLCRLLDRIIERMSPELDKSLIFPGKNGRILNFRNFNRRVWKPALDRLEIPYQHPYVCRHTFISLCLDSGVNVKDVARWVGNSPSVIYRHYIDKKLNPVVPLIY